MPRKPATTRPEPDEDETRETTAEAPEPEASAPTPGPTPASGFFAWLRRIDLRREHGWIGGVCAGVAARLGIDPLIVRGIAVVLAVLGGPALLIYAAARLLLPDTDNRIHLEEVVRGRFEPAVAGIAAMIVLSVLPVWQGFWFGMPFLGEPAWGAAIGRGLWTAALIGLLVWFVVWIARRSTASGGDAGASASSAAFVASTDMVSEPSTAPAPPVGATEPELAAWREQQAQVRAEQAAFRSQQNAERRAADRAAAEQARAERAELRRAERAEWEATRSHPLYSLVVIGLALTAGGLATVLFAAGEPTAASIVVGLATAIAVLAVGIIINGVRGKRAGGAAGVASVLLIPLLFSTISTAGGTADVTWGPYMTFAPTSSETYLVGAGRVDLDLTRVQLGDSSEEVALRLGAGDVLVIVPDGVAVEFSGTVGAGDIDAGRAEDSRRVGPVENVDASFGTARDGEPTLYVSVQLGAGHVAVVTEGDHR